MSTITDSIRKSVLTGSSKYISSGEIFGGAGVVVCPRGKRPENVEGYIVVEADDPVLVSAVIFELRDALMPVMNLDLKDLLYPTIGTAAQAACKKAASRERIVDDILDAAGNVLSDMRLAYFAYGSNMDIQQMSRRCPDAKFVCTATADGWRLWMDQTGYATIEPAEPGEKVEGVLWEISTADELELDRYEGVASGCYEKLAVRVAGDGVTETTLAYASLRRPVRESTHRAGYLSLCIDAACKLGLDATVARMKSFELPM